ncbi:hypothetical protein AJ78_02491 [Emergomyces pasteurianus Ep9510]|uniref:Uncharacterized protein n=1 Tax=Emergomyces pasteurianus Ep9510 TaxID=1447872 RepID=A0A1J9QAZ7_9EURO|nr:hypothetical protein AJ78_02491 [Emergomyces pasteurianus Ep9510]
MERAKEQELRRFLNHLPPQTREYKYSGFQHLEGVVSEEYRRFIDENGSPLVIFTDFPPRELKSHEERFPGRLDYSPPLKILLLTMPSLPHEEAAEAFGYRLAFKADEMGVLKSLSLRGATRTKTPDREKQADRSWAPRDLPPGRSTKWPTVAVEVAFSESCERVKRDVAWWLQESAGEVLVAISIDIKRQSGNIYVNSYEPGRMPTRNHPNPEPKHVQEIAMSRGKDGQPPSLTGGNLIIPFHKLMLRHPRHGESDFIFTREDLLEVADAVWYALEHM